MAKLEDIEGIGAKAAAALRKIGIDTQEEMLEKGARPAARRRMASDAGLSYKRLLGWLNRADLARVKGIGEEYADLLESAGCNTVPQLARRNPTNLYHKMVQVNEAKKLVRTVPSEKVVTKWVEQAGSMPRALYY